MYDEMDRFLENLVNTNRPNYFELTVLLEMMLTKIRQGNIDGYLIETVERFAENKNKNDECYK